MKFYQKRGFALVVLVLAILGSCVYGISKKPALMKRFVLHIFFDVMKNVYEFCSGEPCSPFILLEKVK